MATTFLVAVDFEDASRRAIELAKRLAGPLGAELVLVHAYQVPVYTYPGLDPAAVPVFSTEIEAGARNAIEQLGKDVGIPNTILYAGDPADAILKAAGEAGANFIFMGTHGRRGLAHALLGSVAEQVIRRSDVPVVTIRSGGTG